MVNGRVKAIEQVGTNMWLSGKFTQVKQRNGTVVANVSNLAVFDLQTNKYKDIAPKLGGTDSEVWNMTTYRGDVLIAGEFPGPSSKENNLVRVDGRTGRVIKWFDAPPLKSALAAPDLGRVYGGGIASRLLSSPPARGSGPRRRPPSTPACAPATTRRPTATWSSTARRSGRRACATR